VEKKIGTKSLSVSATDAWTKKDYQTPASKRVNVTGRNKVKRDSQKHEEKGKPKHSVQKKNKRLPTRRARKACRVEIMTPRTASEEEGTVKQNN